MCRLPAGQPLLAVNDRLLVQATAGPDPQPPFGFCALPAAMQRLPPLAVPSKLFSSATNEWQVSGEQFQPGVGSTRP